ncbi:MAG: autotransporter-associated beta strand repeat-containing protein [Verrucomicrobia bacterium]|nr:autotransporter-associated beta strand repeat-containing protein [Verrucomicrobiota bacterium]
MKATNTNEIQPTGVQPVAIKSASPPRRRVLCLTMAALAGFVTSTQAASYTWTRNSAAIQTWTTDANWSGNIVDSGPGTNTDTLTFFPDVTTALADGNNLIITSVPAALTMNVLTINGKGADAIAASNITIGTNAATWTLDGTTPIVNLSGINGTQALNHNVAVNLALAQANTTFTANGTAGFNFSGIISGIGKGITKSGTSTLTLSGANTYSGGTTVNTGVLQLGSTSALPSATTLTVGSASGGTLDLNGNNASIYESGTGNSAGVITDNSAGTGTSTLTLTHNVTTSNALVKDGATQKVAVMSYGVNGSYVGGVFSNSNNTYSGGTTLTGFKRAGFSGTWTGTPGNITSSPFGRGAITIGTSATDQTQFWPSGTQTVLSDLMVNSERGTDQGGTFRCDYSPNLTLAGTITANLSNVGFLMGDGGGTGAVRLTGQITGPRGLDMLVPKHNTAVLTVTLGNTSIDNPNNFQGNTTVYAGTNNVLALGASDQIPDGPSTGNVIINGTFKLNGYSDTINGLSGSGIVDGVSGTPTLTVGGNDQTSTFSGVIKNTAGSLALVKTDYGTLTLTNSNTYSGGTAVNSGVLKVGNLNAALGSGGTTVYGGVLQLGNNAAIGSLTLNGGTLDLGTYSATASVLAFDNTSTLNLVPNGSSYTGIAANGGLTISGGIGSITLNINNSSPVAPGTYTLVGYTGLIGGTGAGFDAFQVGTLPSNPPGARAKTYSLVNDSQKVDLVVQADSPVWSGRAGSDWDTNATQNWVLASNPSTPTFFYTGDAAIFDDAPTNKTVTINGADVTASSVTFSNTSGTYNLSGSNGIAGAALLAKSGAGTLTITNTNTYSLGTTLSDGVLQVETNSVGAAGSVSSGPLGTGPLSIGGGTLSSTNTNPHTLNNTITLTGDATFGDPTNNGALTLGGAVLLSGGNYTLTVNSPVTINGAVGQDAPGRGLTKAGPGNLTLGSSTYSGNTTINGGTLTLNAIPASMNVFIASDAAFQMNCNYLPTVTGSGTWVINSGNGTGYGLSTGSSFAGTTVISYGVRAGTTSQANLPAGPIVIASGGQLFVGGLQLSANLHISGYSWGTTETNGALRLNGENFSGGSFGGTLTLDANAGIAAGESGGTGSISADISGPHELQLMNGTITFSGSNSFGSFLVQRRNTSIPVLAIAGSSTAFGGGGLTVASGDTAQLKGFSLAVANLSGAGQIQNGHASTPSTLTVGSADTSSTTFSGVISNGSTATLALSKTGNGTLILGGANTYTGSTTLSNGILALAATGSLNSSSNLSVAAGATLDVSALGASATYTLGASAALAASGTGTTVGTDAAAIKGGATGTISLGSQPVTLNYDGSNPALYVSQGTLSLNGNAFTVNSAAPLANGVYTIIQQATGSITGSGTYPVVTGTAVGSGKSGAISISDNTVVLTVSGAMSPYQTWAAGFPGFTDTDSTHDPDHDGLTNQQEFAFGLDPTKGSSVNPITIALDQATGKFSYTRLAASGLAYHVLTSTDLQAWAEEAYPVNETVTGTVDGVETVEVTVAALPANGKLFVRVAAQ